MGTDLLLVEAQLQLPQVLLLLPRLIKQPPDAVAHLVKRPCQHVDLFQSARSRPRIQVPAVELFCRPL